MPDQVSNLMVLSMALSPELYAMSTAKKNLEQQDIETIRFWNHQWRQNREGCLLEIWQAVQRRSGCVQIMKMPANRILFRQTCRKLN
jgi:hypothetical protein